MNVSEAVQAYQEQRPTYERFALKLRRLLEELLEDYAFGETIEYRTKEVDQFREKITRVGKNYTDPLTEITDLCGLRIILRRRFDVQRVVDLIQDQFDIDEVRSVYKEDELNVDQFGYSSVHLVVQLKGSRLSLPEWSRFDNLKAEIQVRTILQHAWAQIAHDLDYKTEADVPREVRRRLFRVSAQIETADLELEQFAKEVEKLLETYKYEVSEGNIAIELNVDSLRAYLETSPNLKYWTGFIEKRLNIWIEQTSAPLSEVIDTAEACGVTSLDQIDRVLQEAKGWGEAFFTRYLPNLFQRYFPEQGDFKSYTSLGVIEDLLVASYAERFTQDSLPEAFFADDPFILPEARKARGLKPAAPRTAD
jgi:ppGpp synthetase/RelA/SpoT-type nucleotidyltranferase